MAKEMQRLPAETLKGTLLCIIKLLLAQSVVLINYKKVHTVRSLILCTGHQSVSQPDDAQLGFPHTPYQLKRHEVPSRIYHEVFAVFATATL